MKNSYNDIQIRIRINKFENAISAMAWEIAAKVFEEEQKKLVTELNNIKKIKGSKSAPQKMLSALKLLSSKKGTWDRGSGPYKVIGPGKSAGTYNLKNVTTGKKINAVLKTLALRWKHLP